MMETVLQQVLDPRNFFTNYYNKLILVVLQKQIFSIPLPKYKNIEYNN